MFFSCIDTGQFRRKLFEHKHARSSFQMSPEGTEKC